VTRHGQCWGCARSWVAMDDNRRMSQMPVPEMPAVTPDPSLPRSAWALGWTCLAAQALSLADRGLDQSDFGWVTLSIVASAVVVGWVTAGVLRARPLRVALVWFLFVVGAVLSLIGLIDPGATHGYAVLGGTACRVGPVQPQPLLPGATVAAISEPAARHRWAGAHRHRRRGARRAHGTGRRT
jgi:hypothetical protein